MLDVFLETCNQIRARIKSFILLHKWEKIFKNGPSKICGRQPLKSLKGNGLLRQTIPPQIFYRLSSTNFTWSILEYSVPFDPFNPSPNIAIFSIYIFPIFSIYIFPIFSFNSLLKHLVLVF